jgi:hypothetical protein
MDARIVAVDVGSIAPPSRFAWAALDAPEKDIVARGSDPDTAASALLAGLRAERKAALLLESPLAVPVPTVVEDGWRLLGKARHGEGNRPWSAGAGAGVLATGLAQGAWMLARLAAADPGLLVTTQFGEWSQGGAQLLLAEAFVSGLGKPVPLPAGQDAADAAAAGLALVRFLEQADPPASEVRCAPHTPVNLWAAIAMWAGLQISAEELQQDVLVIRVRPELTG